MPGRRPIPSVFCGFRLAVPWFFQLPSIDKNDRTGRLDCDFCHIETRPISRNVSGNSGIPGSAFESKASRRPVFTAGNASVRARWEWEPLRKKSTYSP